MTSHGRPSPPSHPPGQPLILPDHPSPNGLLVISHRDLDFPRGPAQPLGKLAAGITSNDWTQLMLG